MGSEKIVKSNKIKEYGKRFDKQVSESFIDDFDKLVRELLITIIIHVPKDKKRLNSKHVAKLKKIIDNCLNNEKVKNKSNDEHRNNKKFNKTSNE